ncbi:hypothetical protein CAter282_3083 [Collimonas arenae]|uniref:DegT/DnrJ/EryC1/StrS aminotransferase family protein n=1 Tax=Collimonas arenae TaxID=279058 RepID=A0A127PSV0_9BURK|nr:hypothetical protein [Collimonas arenae]AMP00901.1 hypothetical protein CAter10_3386 [Collimonas arenae]AMP10794.1 hypothetical protein CAter282_3083 [Collimonas arenae]
MLNTNQDAIGGYLELELPQAVHQLHRDAIKFQSARAALHALLLAGRPKRVWLPKYICNAIPEVLFTLDIECCFYDLDPQMGVAASVNIADNDWLLHVNYFGICGQQQQLLASRFDPSQLIFDHSQAYFSPPGNGLATIYSPRKFFGMPDGGLLLTSLAVAEPEQLDTHSLTRCAHLLARLHSVPEAGYAAFQQAERTLSDSRPLGMSPLSRRLLDSIDGETVRHRRNSNFQFLHSRLKHLNRLPIEPKNIDGPLCYPLLCSATGVRETLLAKRIFVPSYWPEVAERTVAGSIEQDLLANCLPLPCDQRYDQTELLRVVDTLLDQLREN